MMTNTTGLIDQFKQELDAVSDGCEELLKSSTADLQSLEAQFEQFVERVAELPDTMQDELEKLEDRVEAWKESLDDSADAFRERIDQLDEQFAETVTSEWEETASSCSELLTTIENSFEQLLNETVAGTLTETRDAMLEFVDENKSRLSTIEDHFQTAIHQAFNEMKRYVGESLSHTLKDQAEKTGEAVIDRLKQEIVDCVTESELQAQLTAMIFPYISQLAAAKASAPIIRQGLELMRSGGF